MSSRRPLATAGLAAAALLAPLLWLFPALALQQAPSFRDQGDFFFPLKLYTADRLASGSIPLWNPLSGAGEPWLANAQSGVFYLPTFFFLLPFPALAAALYLLLHFGIAAWGAWKFLKEENVSDAGALFGVTACIGCGFAASLSAYWNHFGAWAYLPAIAALAREGLPKRASVLGLATLLAFQAMAGSPELSIATVAVAAVLLFFPRPETPMPHVAPGARRRLLRFGAAGLLALALSAWVILPLAELIWHSDRRVPLPTTVGEAGTVTLQGLASLVGWSSQASGTPYLASLYAGPLLLLAAAAALIEPERRRLVIVLAIIGAIGVLVSAAGPPGSWLRRLPPLDRWRYPAKLLSLTFFSLAMLAGLGLDSLRFLRARGRSRWLMAALGAAALALCLVSPMSFPVRAAGAIGAFALLLLCALPLRSFNAAGALACAAGLAFAVSLALAGRGLFRFVAEDEIRREPASAARLRQVNGRVLTPPMIALAQIVLRSGRGDETATVRLQREALLGYTNLLYAIPTIRTAAALPTAGARRIADSIDSAADPGETAGRAGARALWTPFQPLRLPSRKIGEFFRAPLERYRPRLRYALSYRVERDPARAWALSLATPDREGLVVLDREPEFRPARAAAPLFLARVAEDAAETVAVDVTSGSPGLLVLADLHYPGWTAQTDGRPVDLLVADGVFRAVSLPAGTHRVVFHYRPTIFYAGAVLSAAGLLTLLLLAWRGEPVPIGRRR